MGKCGAGARFIVIDYFCQNKTLNKLSNFFSNCLIALGRYVETVILFFFSDIRMPLDAFWDFKMFCLIVLSLSEQIKICLKCSTNTLLRDDMATTTVMWQRLYMFRTTVRVSSTGYACLHSQAVKFSSRCLYQFKMNQQLKIPWFLLS